MSGDEERRREEEKFERRRAAQKEAEVALHKRALEDDIRALEQKKRTAAQKMRAISTEIQQLEAIERRAHRGSVKNSADAMRSIDRKLVALRATITDSTLRIRKTQDELAEHEAESQKLAREEEDAENKETEQSHLREKVSGLLGTKRSIEQNIRDLTLRIRSLTTRGHRSSANLSKLQIAVTTEKTNLSRLQDTVRELEGELRRVHEQINAHERTLAETQQAVRAAERDSEEDSMTAREIAEARAQLAELEITERSIESEERAMQEKVSQSPTRDAVKARNAIAREKETSTDLLRKLRDLEASLDTAERDLRALEADRENFESEARAEANMKARGERAKDREELRASDFRHLETELQDIERILAQKKSELSRIT